MASDLFDPFDPLHDEAAELYDDEGRKRCLRCGAGDLEWDRHHHHHDTTGVWRLWEGEWPDGRVHRCRAPNYTQAALDFGPARQLGHETDDLVQEERQSKQQPKEES